MWNNYISLLMMATLLRMDYELNQPEDTYTDTFALPTLNRPVLNHQQKQWADKAVERYAEAQEKKWLRWNKAMFERSD